jgi:Mg-chelatase subunit ChlD
MKRVVLSCLLAVLVVLPAAVAETNKARPRIEVVFCLDTTGSMSGLIAAAKEKIWAIANTLATSKPTPEIKMGLVGYRDRGDDYVTKVTGLSDDLDAIYKKLMAFQAGGGGDGPESVNQALHEAVTKVTWSTDDTTYRVIFLVGDYPPHMDYKQDVKYPASCELAAKRAIIINTIQCGTHSATMPIWQDIAKRSEGQYFRVEQSGGAILAATPYDKKLAELGAKLDQTRVYYGTETERNREEGRVKLAEKISGAASGSASARRAVFNSSKSGERNFLGNQELVQAVSDGTVKLEDLEDKELPEELRKMNAEERKAYVEKQAKVRADLQAKIKELAAKREKHIAEQIEKNKVNAEASLDHGVFKALRKQAGEKGIDVKTMAH